MSEASQIDKAATPKPEGAAKPVPRKKAIKAAIVAKAKLDKSILGAAKRFVKNRPNDHLSSLLVELRELNITRKNPGAYYAKRDFAKNIGAKILANEGREPNDPFYFPDVRNGSYALNHVSPIRYLSQFIRPDTTAIMELGSGWSVNLFQLYIAHGATRSKKIKYFGGEKTKEGQITAKYIAQREPGLTYQSFQFDFLNPNVTFLKNQRGHILLYTSHAMQDVENVNPALFSQLREIPNPVTVVHFEPVGWQRVPKLMRMRESNDEAFFEKVGEKALEGNLRAMTENAAWWSWRQKYNVNLLRIVNALESERSIEMQRLEYDFSGAANVFNPVTLIHYDFLR